MTAAKTRINNNQLKYKRNTWKVEFLTLQSQNYIFRV